MFKFDFDIEDDSGDEGKATYQDVAEQGNEDSADERPFVEHALVDMLNTLPDDVSYSSVQVGELHIPRRDLFDVRLQLIASEKSTDEEKGRNNHSTGESQAAVEFAERPSDLIPRVYEGGMKTWECSLDLADYVNSEQSGVGELRGERILELGCGTAIPTLAVLRKIFDSTIKPDGSETEIHVQDYNASVLEYVTLPNIILTWFFSEAGKSYRSTLPPPSPKPTAKSKLPDIANLSLESVPEEDEDEGATDAPIVEQPAPPTEVHYDPKEPGDLAFNSALQAAFVASLKEYRIKVRLFSGPWDGFDIQAMLGDGSYDLILTSETVYQPSNLPSLVRLLRSSTGSKGICLVAAKMVYFGVGGGVQEFEQALARDRGTMKSVWEQTEGVRRGIFRVEFHDL